MEGPTKHSGKDYWFSADVLTAKQVAETLAEATGRKSQPQFVQPKLFRARRNSPVQYSNRRMQREGSNSSANVDDGRMAYVGSVKRRYRENSGTRAIVLREWANYTPMSF